MRCRAIACAAVLSFATAAVAQVRTHLAYQVAGDTKIETVTTADVEGSLFMPIMGRMAYQAKEKSTTTGQLVEEPYGDTGDWKVTGTKTIDATFNDAPQDRRTESLGPAVFTFNEQGELQGTKLEPFDPTQENIARFRWWSYITQQLDLPPALPFEDVAPGETWSSAVVLSGPDGKPLRGKAQYKFLGTGSGTDQDIAWIREETTVPIKVRISEDTGRLEVDGKIRVDRLFAFDTDKGMTAGSTERSTADLAIKLESDTGEEFEAQIILHRTAKTTVKHVAGDG